MTSIDISQVHSLDTAYHFFYQQIEISQSSFTMDHARQIVNQLDAGSAMSGTTILYSSTKNTGFNADALGDAGLRLINHTEVGGFLDATYFKRWYNDNLTADQITKQVFEADTNSLWGNASQKFAKVTSGDVFVIVGDDFNSSRVFGAVELPELLLNDKVTHINGMDKSSIIASFTAKGISLDQIGASDFSTATVIIDGEAKKITDVLTDEIGLVARNKTALSPQLLEDKFLNKEISAAEYKQLREAGKTHFDHNNYYDDQKLSSFTADILDKIAQYGIKASYISAAFVTLKALGIFGDIAELGITVAHANELHDQGNVRGSNEVWAKFVFGSGGGLIAGILGGTIGGVMAGPLGLLIGSLAGGVLGSYGGEEIAGIM
ncbi:MAG: hypothetical protein HRU28_18055, partial [Rhizobiales bacterium]|nr:hypothetical protein [Hyphomicrobiales bacterium]